MINRNITKHIRKWLGQEKIIILKGARQVGKTTLMDGLMKELKQQNKQVLSFSCDQELSNPIFADQKLFVHYIKNKLPQKGRLYIFMDEFQYITDAGMFLKVVFDQLKSRIQIIVSGSSSLEISKNSEYLTGRKVEFYLTTVSFLEFVQFKSDNPFTEYANDFEKMEVFNTIYGQELQHLALEYFNWGGYPEIVENNDEHFKSTVLKEIVTTYIQKDIAAFLKIDNISAFNKLITLLSQQAGNLVNKSELSSTLQLNYNTLTKYMSILHGTYVFDFLRPYNTNIRKELTKMPKVFINDLGMKKNIDTNNEHVSYHDITQGNVAENFAYLILKDMYAEDSLFYYRTKSKAKIDFIIKSNNSLIPLEIKFKSIQGNSTTQAMSNFAKEYKDLVHWQVICSKDTQSIDYNNKLLTIPLYLLPFYDLTKLPY